MKSRSLSIYLAGLMAIGTATVHTQTAGRSQQPATPAEVTQAIAAARASRSAGRLDEAMATMAAIVKKHPANAEATQYQIGLWLEIDRPDEAFKAYDAYVAARKQPDAAALRLIARADLRRTVRARADQPMLQARALERLARDGDAESLRALQQLSASRQSVSPNDLAPTISLARLKDPGAELKLTQLLNVQQPLEKAQVIQAIGEGGARGLAPRVAGFLSDPDHNVRTAAVTTLGLLQAREAIPQVRTVYDTDTPAVKMFAAVAMKRLGQASADGFLEGLLNGQIAELRVIAAGAYIFSTTQTPAWQKAVKELLSGPNEQHRLQGAELLACCDRAGARSALTSMLAGGNPLLRGGAAKVIESRPELGDLTIARRLLGDPAEAVRIHGAGLTLALARGGAAGRGGALLHDLGNSDKPQALEVNDALTRTQRQR